MYVCLAQYEVNSGFECRSFLRDGHVDDGS